MSILKKLESLIKPDDTPAPSNSTRMGWLTEAGASKLDGGYNA